MNTGRMIIMVLFVGLLAAGCGGENNVGSDKEVGPAGEEIGQKEPAAISLLGKPLYPPPPPRELLEKYTRHRAAYAADPDDPMKLIWFGRFAAYCGKYAEALALYTRGIKEFPEDPRFYRHRGHRYITLRQFHRAIQDLEEAARLIAGTQNRIEPDGMPNARGIPVSTLHGNIWYHLGLAYYLTHDLENALRSFRNSLAASENDDNLVSSTHWIYMILRRLGRTGEAESSLRPISRDLEIIENFAYHRICLFYRGIITREELTGGRDGEAASDDAINYALGNWDFYHGRREKAAEIFREILSHRQWASFGYIAAEADFDKEYGKI